MAIRTGFAADEGEGRHSTASRQLIQQSGLGAKRPGQAGDRNSSDDRRKREPLTCSPRAGRSGAAVGTGSVSLDFARRRIDGTLRLVLALAATALAARHESLPVPGCRRMVDILGSFGA